MRRTLVLAISALMLFVIASPAQESAKGKPSPTPTPTPAPTLSVMWGSCDSGDTVCESANRVRNDVAGKPYVHGSEGVSLVFYSGGSRDLVFRLDGSPTRTLRFDFRDNAGTGNLPQWWSTAPQQNVKQQLNVIGAYYAKEQCGTEPICSNHYTTFINAGYWKAAGDNKTTYALLWNPFLPRNPDRPVNDPLKTSAVDVHYIKDESGERFIITPLPSADCFVGSSCEAKPYIAGMEATSGRTVSGAGQYHMPFTMTVKVN